MPLNLRFISLIARLYVNEMQVTIVTVQYISGIWYRLKIKGIYNVPTCHDGSSINDFVAISISGILICFQLQSFHFRIKLT